MANKKPYVRPTVASVKSSPARPEPVPKTGGSQRPPEAMQFQVKVSLLEDLHSGTGHSAGDLDGVQLKDRAGNPMIFRGHLKGLLREAGDVLVALGLAQPDDVTDVFGAPNALGRGTLTITSLYVGEAGSSRVEWTSTGRKEDDRGPQEDTLRTVEHVGAGTVFNALFELITGPKYARQKELVERCFQHVVALGSGRNLGDGRIMTAVTQTPSKPPEPFAVSFGGNLRSNSPVSAATLRLRLVLRNLDPVCFPITGEPGNLIFSAGFMGGAAHRGGWIGALTELGHDSSWILEDQGPAFLDALPMPPDALGERTDLAAIVALPIPLDHVTRKPPAQDIDGWPWWGEPSPIKPSDDRKPKRPGDTEFLYRPSRQSPWIRYAPELRVHLRNNTGDVKRRKLDQQSLYSVEEIVERTDFLTEITFADLTSAQKFIAAAKPILEGRKWLKLGRGGAPATVVGHVWLAQDKAAELPAGQDKIVMVLTSDLILRGPRLGYLSSLTTGDILRLAELDPKTLAGLDPLMLVSNETKIDTTLVHGFNASSGLPRNPALAIRRGSSFLLQSTPSTIALLWQALWKKAAVGIGTRRQEGHGRFKLEKAAIAESVPYFEALPKSTSIERIEGAIDEGIDLARKLWAEGPFVSRPSKGQLEQLRRDILRSPTQQTLESRIYAYKGHAGTVGGEAWKAFNFAAIDVLRRNSNFGNNLENWKVVLDTALRKLAREVSQDKVGDHS